MPRPAPILDRAFATVAFDWSSAYFVNHPNGRLARKIAGPHPRRWHAVTTHADEVPEWLTIPGDETAGQFRSTFTRGVAIGAEQAEMGTAISALEREYGGSVVPAAAFRVGHAIVAAEIPAYQGNRLHPPEDFPDQSAAVLGLGDRALIATVGALHLESGEFAGARGVWNTDADYLQMFAVTYPNTPQL